MRNHGLDAPCLLAHRNTGRHWVGADLYGHGLLGRLRVYVYERVRIDVLADEIADWGGYLKTFIGHRVLPLYLFNVLLAVTYFVLLLLLGSDAPTFGALCKSFLFGSTVVPFGWYFQSIILIYLLFYAVAHLTVHFVAHHKKRALLLGMAIAMALYVALCLVMRLGTTWYETSIAFLVGMVIAARKEQVCTFLTSKRITIAALLISVICFCATFVLANTNFVPEDIRVTSKMLSSAMFALCWIPILRLVKLTNPITLLLSKHYLEIYALQGAAFLLLSNKCWNLQNQYLYFISSILLTFILALIAKPFISAYMARIKEWASSKRFCR